MDDDEKTTNFTIRLTAEQNEKLSHAAILFGKSGSQLLEGIIDCLPDWDKENKNFLKIKAVTTLPEKDVDKVIRDIIAEKSGVVFHGPIDNLMRLYYMAQNIGPFYKKYQEYMK